MVFIILAGDKDCTINKKYSKGKCHIYIYYKIRDTYQI